MTAASAQRRYRPLIVAVGEAERVLGQRGVVEFRFDDVGHGDGAFSLKWLILLVAFLDFLVGKQHGRAGKLEVRLVGQFGDPALGLKLLRVVEQVGHPRRQEFFAHIPAQSARPALDEPGQRKQRQGECESAAVG